ncbi:hypothetical protein Q8A67_014002 [Cirrhinus molitorella]|uniref:Ig-like domain-containing protein n=1 Tax=Cirrhinus molitorella TaxID=172907 RepID=A0AA88PJC2_9TELE|nr:hypothetical protein Q8A67_014002 [Cirrhinus molitorella]
MDMGMISKLQVIVEAPIGSVEVSTSCSSNQTSVSCSSEGDRITYSWILNGKILEQGFMNGKTTIQLNEGTDGNISCSVKNFVSHGQETIRVKPCPEAATPAVTSSLTSTVISGTQTPELSVVFVLVWCFQLMVLLGLLGGFHIYMRHTSDECQLGSSVTEAVSHSPAGIGVFWKLDLKSEMMLIFGLMLLLLLLQMDACLDRFCWFDQSDSCYAALGHKLNLPLVLGASEYDLKIPPIGSVEVSIICSSSGVMRVSCSSEGDLLLYSWTLNGDPLMDGNSSIDLDEETDGDISCSVKNHVSHMQKTIRVKPCSGATIAPATSSLTSAVTISTHTSECVCSVSVEYVLVWCFQLMVLLGLLGGFHIYMRHTSGNSKITT